jgi:hypothetical protein
MTKRPQPKKQEPWPAFTLVTITLAVAAVVSAILLDYIGARRGRRPPR